MKQHVTLSSQVYRLIPLGTVICVLFLILYWCLTECVVFKILGFFLMAWSDPLRSNLQELEKVLPTSMRKTHGKAERSDDFDCTVCLKLLYEPITTPCGHTFCRSCLFQSMDRGRFIWLIFVLLLKICPLHCVTYQCFVEYRQQMSTMSNCHFYDSTNMRCQVKFLHSSLFSL